MTAAPIPGVVAEALRAHPPGLPQPAHRTPLRDDVDRAAALLRPFIEAALQDRSLSFDQALVIVVADPEAPPGTPFDEALLVRHDFGRAGEVDVDYGQYALGKARAAHRERCDTALLRERAAALTSELPLVGGLHRRGWTVGVSGAVPHFDEAVGAMFIELVHALRVHRVASEATPT